MSHLHVTSETHPQVRIARVPAQNRQNQQAPGPSLLCPEQMYILLYARWFGLSRGGAEGKRFLLGRPSAHCLWQANGLAASPASGVVRAHRRVRMTGAGPQTTWGFAFVPVDGLRLPAQDPGQPSNSRPQTEHPFTWRLGSSSRRHRPHLRTVSLRLTRRGIVFATRATKSRTQTAPNT